MWQTSSIPKAPSEASSKRQRPLFYRRLSSVELLLLLASTIVFLLVSSLVLALPRTSLILPSALSSKSSDHPDCQIWPKTCSDSLITTQPISGSAESR